MKAPAGLGSRGRALWRSISKGLPEGWELDERELEILGLAARQADDLKLLEAGIEKYGTMVTGSAGQPVLSPAVVEARQARLAISRLLGAVSLPDESRQPRTVAGVRGQKAARSRWDRRDDLEQLKKERRGA